MTEIIMLSKMTTLIAVVVSLSSLLICVLLMNRMFRKIKTEIEMNSLKNSTYNLLELNIWDLRSRNKDLDAKLQEAIADSIRAHQKMRLMAKKMDDGK